MFRSSPPEVFSKKDTVQIRWQIQIQMQTHRKTTAQKRDPNKADLQLY